MVRALTKPAFGALSTELVGRIENSDAVSAARAAGYRFEAKLSELGRQYELKASELRQEYLGELAALGGEEAQGA